MQHSNDEPDAPGREPVEGRPDLNLPGADREPEPDPNSDLPRRLGDRIENGPGAGVAGEPDLVPDVEVPEETM
jgi:hypothetical protein